MDEEYDLICLGTDPRVGILSAVLQQKGMKVLTLDKESYYGGQGASVSLTDLYKRFRPESPEVPKFLGDARYWSVDLCPKFLMSGGNLVKLLRSTGVTRYLDFLLVSGSYVANGGKIHKVPASAGEALATPLLGFFEKRRFKNFLQWVDNYDFSNPSTWEGVDVKKTTTREVFAGRSLGDDAVEFTGHAIALHQNDDYLNQPAADTVKKCKLYADSLARFGSSPFIYPKYGLGGIPEGFSRLCAVAGGVQMLEKKIEELVYEDGKIVGVKVEGTVIKTKMVLADPTYMLTLEPTKVKQNGSIIRSIVLMQHAVPNTSNADSLQLIIPAKQLKRKNDIYVTVVSSQQAVAADGWYIAVVSTILEGPEANAQNEIKAAYEFLGGSIRENFTWVAPYLVPVADGADNVFVTSSMDPTSHFEVATDEVLSLFKKITGSDIDLDKLPDNDDDM